ATRRATPEPKRLRRSPTRSSTWPALTTRSSFCRLRPHDRWHFGRTYRDPYRIARGVHRLDHDVAARRTTGPGGREAAPVAASARLPVLQWPEDRDIVRRFVFVNHAGHRHDVDRDRLSGFDDLRDDGQRRVERTERTISSRTFTCRRGGARQAASWSARARPRSWRTRLRDRTSMCSARHRSSPGPPDGSAGRWRRSAGPARQLAGRPRGGWVCLPWPALYAPYL